MSLIGQFTVNDMDTLVLSNCVFPTGFYDFLNSLATVKVVNEDYSSVHVGGRYLWNDKRHSGGALVETSNFPFENTVIGEVMFIASKHTLYLIETILQNHNVQYDIKQDTRNHQS